MTASRSIVVGITGASGAVYARRTVQLLAAAEIDVHLVVSPLGQRLLHDELGLERVDEASLLGTDEATWTGRVTMHRHQDVGATIASGSFRHDGMVIVPCSSNTLAAVASGSAQNLIHRAAHVTLKERRRLVLVHRETPLSLVDIRNMAAVTEAGGIVCPANPGFYMMPQGVEQLVDFMVGRALDLLNVEHDLDIRWADQLGKGDTPR